MLSLTIEGGDLRDAAAWVGRLAPVKHSIPILQGVMLTADDESGMLTLSAYDLETAGTATVTASVLSSGRTLVSGRLLAAIAKTLDPKKDVILTDESGQVSLTVGRNRWVLPCLDVRDYPQLPAVGETAAKLDAPALRRAIERCLPAADRTNAEPLRGAVALVSAGQTLTIVGLDRHRMAVVDVEYDGPEIDLLVPTTFLEAGIAVMAPGVAAAELGFTSGAVYLSSGSRALTGRIVAGEWPSWRPLLPSVDQPTSAIFVVGDLLAAVDRVLAVADDERAVRLSVSEDGFEIETIDDRGSANAEALVSEYEGDPKMTAVKPRYLRDALQTMQSDLAVMRTGPKTGAKLDFVPLDEGGAPVTDYRHIVMPMDPKKLGKRT